jgi:hypothetical protein
MRPRIALLILFAAAAAMVAWTWQTWPDAVSDSGRELYVAWQLASGKVLYRDVAYFNGPLSPYLNALWFAIAGPGLSILEVANGVLALVAVVLSWRFVRRLAGPAEATACTLLFATVFLTGPLTAIGSFSWLIPYSHEMTHGVLLLLVLLVALERWLTRRGTPDLVTCGLLTGACLLTKPEITLAAGAMLVTAFGLAEGRRAWRPMAIAGATALSVPLAAWAVLSAAMPAGVALNGIVGSWAHLTDSRLTTMPYFRMFLGSDRPLANLGAMLAWSAAWVAIAAVAVLVGRIAGTRERAARAIGAAAAIGVAAALVAGRNVVPWHDVFRPLPVAAACVLAWAAAGTLRAREASARIRGALTATAAAGALALTFKMFLFARVWHYGFALGMPAALLAVASIGAAVRRVTLARGGSPFASGGVLAGALAGTIAGHLFLMAPIVKVRDVRVGTGRDVFMSDARGVVINATVAAAARRARGDTTLAILPDGVMISYLARLPNSTPYVIGNPVDVAIFGEERMLAAYRANPPDLLAVTWCDTTIYGYPGGFGRDYARSLRAWIATSYELAEQIPGTGDGDFRATLLRRKGYVVSRSSVTNEASGANVSSR